MDEKKNVTVYMVDSENVNDVWILLATMLPEEDQLLIFYTDKSQNVSYERVIELMKLTERHIEWIKCMEGTNALDFQLVTELGARVATSDHNFVIVSNDTGFDAAVKYWVQRGRDVSRMRSTDCKRLAQALGDDTIEVLSPEEEARQEMQARLNDIDHLGASLPLSDLTLYHDAFVCMYEPRRADDLYHYMKDNKEQFEYLEEKYLPEREDRQKKYFELVMKNAGYDVKDSDQAIEVYQHMEDPEGNLQKMSEELVQIFDRDLGIEYYRLIKKNIRLLGKL